MNRRFLLLVLPVCIALAAGFLPTVAREQDNPRLRADAMRVLSCLAQSDAPVHVPQDFRGADRLRVRYRYFTERLPTGDGKYENAQDLALLIYRQDYRAAYFFKVWMRAVEDPKKLQLWNALYLEKAKEQWEPIELWQGGMGVLAEEQQSLRVIFQSSPHTILRSTLPRPDGPCWVPAPDVGRYGIRLGSPGTAF